MFKPFYCKENLVLSKKEVSHENEPINFKAKNTEINQDVIWKKN